MNTIFQHYLPYFYKIYSLIEIILVIILKEEIIK